MSEYNLKRSGTASEDLEVETRSSPSKLQKRPLYSKQQLKIAEYAKGPGQQDVSIIRITAAAGTGKTTTLKLLAEVLQTLGHTNISYITFNKTAAEQMKMPFVTSKTIHSWAFLLLNVKENNAFLLKTDTAFEDAIHRICGENVSNFLRDMLEESKLEKQRKRKAEKFVRSYLMKTLKKFFQSAKNVKEGLDYKEYKNVYYPARLWHEGKLKNNQLLPGVPTAYSANDKLKVARFYLQNAKLIWNRMTGKYPSILTHDSTVKRAQLKNVKIPGDASLADETQDFNACQFAWYLKQASSYKTQLFIVGDAAQAIYGFRGAKSSNLLAIANNYKVVDCELTESYRFGPTIAAVANVILGCKENSPQTIGQYTQTWNPYRMTGVGASGYVTIRNLINEIHPSIEQGGGRNPVTVIAYKNIELLEFFLKLPNYRRGNGDDNGHGNEFIRENGQQNQMKRPSHQYKISLYGNGESSGRNNWVKVGKKLADFFNIFSERSSELKHQPWSALKETITWKRVISDVETFELDEYNLVIELIEKYQFETLIEYGKFEMGVINAEHSLGEADIILTTVHAAKGMEWDRVMVLDETLKDLSTFKIVTPGFDKSSPVFPQPFSQSPGFKAASNLGIIDHGCSAQLDWQSYGDDYNLWYVALTRAKKVLSVPPKFMKLLNDLQGIHEIVSSRPVVRTGQCSPITRPMEPTSMNEENSIGMNEEGNRNANKFVTPVKVKSTNGVILDQPDPYFGGKQWSIEELRLIHRDIFLPLQTDIQSKGGLVIDNKAYFK